MTVGSEYATGSLASLAIRVEVEEAVTAGQTAQENAAPPTLGARQFLASRHAAPLPVGPHVRAWQMLTSAHGLRDRHRTTRATSLGLFVIVFLIGSARA